MTLVDTHAHLHFDAYTGRVPEVLHQANEAGVTKILNVGVSTADSKAAVELAATYDSVWAAVGIHPYEAQEAEQGIGYLRELAGRRKVVAIGECGLDLHKATATLQEQERALRLQIELAQDLDLPLIFHVREAFDQFWKVTCDYGQLSGVVHSFSGGPEELHKALEAGLYVALNGIITFTQVDEQLEVAKVIPADRLLLETDAPFLSPAPRRGKVNAPASVADIAEFVATLRGESVSQLARTSTAAAEELFGLA